MTGSFFEGANRAEALCPGVEPIVWRSAANVVSAKSSDGYHFGPCDREGA